MLANQNPSLAADRIQVVYQIYGDAEGASDRAKAICLEQTVEVPDDLVPSGFIRQNIIGRLVDFRRLDAKRFNATISYAQEVSAFEIPQLLNTIFGNTSLIPGVRVERIDLPDALTRVFKGPRFGRSGLREILGVHGRALLCSALKPMGLSAAEFADIAYRLALGGIDIIKDDHGLANQPFAPFDERVQRCADAVRRANQRTGCRSIYMPNITAPIDRIIRNARFAKDAGATGMLVSPGLVGFDTMRHLADDDAIGLPIMSHPALLGSYVTRPEEGMSHFVLFGQITRLCGADASIFPNYEGRFSFSRSECVQIIRGAETPMGNIKPIFPTPGGGVSLQRIPELRALYGQEVIFLVGGDLLRHTSDLIATCRRFADLVTQEIAFAPEKRDDGLS